MALIGTISGSNGTSTTAISGSVIIADRPPGEFPSLPSNAKFYVSGTRDVNGPLGAIAIFGGDIFVTGGLGVSDYVQMLPVNELRIPTNTSASYIYTSGSTNDMYFTQYTGPYTNTTRLRWLESALSSGLLHGGILSTQNGTTTFSITSGSGLIVYQNATTLSDPYPTIRFVEWSAYVSQSLQYSGSAQITYISIDPDGEIDQSPIAFNTEQFKDRIVLGRILHQSGSVTSGATNTPTTAYAVSQNTNDFVRAFGPLKISGHFLSASGSAPTLSIIKTAGSSYVEGRNYSVDPNNPNIVNANTDLDVTVSKIYREYVSGSTPIIDTGIANAGYTVLNPGLYNNNGTLAAVGNGEFSIQRVFWFPRAINKALFVYYGSAKYSTIDDAIVGIGTENFIEGDNTAGSAIFVGYICLKGDASDLLTASQARIFQGGLFRGSAGASFGGAGGSSTLPGGSDTHVQFNDDNAFGGESGFTFNKLTNSATLVGDINAANANLSSNVNAAVASITGNAYASGTLYAKDVSIFGNLTVTSGSTIISGSGDVSIQSQTGSINIGTDINNAILGSETVQIPSASNNTFSQPNGTLTSPNFPSNYPASADGYTVFSGIPGVYRTITGTINTEGGFDFVRVYNGTGTGGTLLYTRSGLSTSFSFTSNVNQTFTVRFTSDTSAQFAGFSLTVAGIYSQDITIGGGTSSRAIRIGNISNNLPLILSGGAGGITLTTDAVVGNIDITNTSTGVLNLFNDTGTGAVNIVGSSATGARSINIGTGGTGSKTITIGDTTGVTSGVTIAGGTIEGINIATAAVATPVSIANSTTAGTVNIGTGTATQTLSFGSGAGAKTITVGSSTGASSLSLQSGTGNLNIGNAATNKTILIGQTANTSNLSLNGGTGGITLSVGATAGTVTLTGTSTGLINIGNDTGTGAISIGSSTGARQINIGNGATSTGNVNIVGSSATGARTVDIGTGGTNIKVVRIGNNSVAGSTTTIAAGTTGGVNIGTAAVATPVNIATNTTAGTTSIGTGTATQTVDVNTGAGVKTTTVGSTNTTSTTTINGGTNGVNIATAAVAAPVNIANNTTAGTVNVGTGSATQTLNFGTGAGIKTVTVGSRNTTSTTLINAGTGGVTISSGSTTAASIGNDVFFYVSGNIATKPATSPNFAVRGTTVFGGDVVISGTLFGSSPLYIGDDVVIGTNQILGSSGGITIAFTGSNVTIPNNLILSGNAYFGNSSGDSLFVTASSYFSSSAIFYNGITGSITKLSDGTDYFRAGSNISLTTGSSGEVTVAVTGLAGGDVFGPGSATNDAVAVYDGTTGKLIKNSNLLVGTRTTTQAYVTASVNLTDYGLALIPNGTGSLSAHAPDETTTGGNNRGANSIDFQTVRSLASQVASGQESAVVGGRRNTASGVGSTIVGGDTNIASSAYTFIGGGSLNVASGSYSVVVGGQYNSSSADYAHVGGGQYNTGSAAYASVGGGFTNRAGAAQSSISGGGSNTINLSRDNSFIGGGQSNTIQSAGTHISIVGGQSNTAQTAHSTIGGGQSNTTSTNTHQVIGGGLSNRTTGRYSTIPGGQGAITNNWGELSFAAGFNSAAGDAQTSMCTWRRSFTNTVVPLTTELLLDGNTGGTERFVLASNTVVTFQIQIVIVDTVAGTTGGYIINGVAKNIGGTSSLVGATTITSFEDSATWSATVDIVDSTTDYLRVQITTDGTTNSMRTVATGIITQAKF